MANNLQYSASLTGAPFLFYESRHFIVRNTELTLPGGQLGYMSPFVWMFISSYENLRNFLINEKTITSLVQLEYSGFDGATVPICTFTLENTHHEFFKGGYIRLSDFKGAENQGPKTLEAIKNPDCGWFYRASAADFKIIPGSPIAYWVSDKIRNIFSSAKALDLIAEVKHGLSTGKNEEVVRFWAEVSEKDFAKNMNSHEDAMKSGLKWFPYNKGGYYRKWYGNFEYVLRYDDYGQDLMASFSGHRHDGKSHYFKEGVTWTFISSSKFAARYTPNGYVFDVSGSMLFTEHCKIVLSLLCTELCFNVLKTLNPTLNFQVGNLKAIPILDKIIENNREQIHTLANRGINYSRLDWDSYETSWDFTRLPLLQAEYHQPTLQESYSTLRKHWREMTREMQQLEEENNRIFIEAYGLQDELSPEVPLNEITLTCNPYYRYGINKPDEELEALLLLDTIKEYISYAVGCMLGRYSLDKEGLVFAGGEFDPRQYKSFPADQDNVIPILAEDYFQDDIITRFVEFVRLTFSATTLEENLDFIADTLGRRSKETARDTIRRYFVNDFYKDHVQRYKKRPIYWLFTSGKEKAFNCLVYLHRYQPDTIATLRTEYLHRLQEAVEVEKQQQQRIIAEEAG
ncbi:MAG: BREX-1 system adenine-specific DNA-methyltransferase PglX, partial [Syntrophomonas sp.]|nr:BREX-1 system adenine-specific DNA-methyltransferase PglX [Syntrophomonas sp.]